MNKKLKIYNKISKKNRDKYAIEDSIKNSLFLDYNIIKYCDLYSSLDKPLNSSYYNKFIVANDTIYRLIIEKTNTDCDFIIDCQYFADFKYYLLAKKIYSL